nr:response regulator [uncultured Flavobacterium sp.]
MDLVISDIGMPRMGGEQALQKLQEINPQVKTIFITGYLDPKAIDNVYQLGAKGVIHKPFNMEEVFKTIDNVMA